MAYISIEEVNAWLAETKITALSLDVALETSIVNQVFASVRKAYDVSSWANAVTTPSLVRNIISMLYAGWYYERTLSEDNNVASYGMLLINSANKLIEDIVGGSVILDPALPVVVATNTYSQGQPGFEPTAIDDGPAFTMGKIW